MKTDNPAARLHATLSAVIVRPEKETMRQAWAHVFGLEVDETGEILRRLSLLLAEKAKAEQEVRALSETPDVFLRPLRGLDRLFSTINLDEHCRIFTGRIPEATLETLETVAETLRLKDPRGELSDDDQEQMLRRIDELSEHVRTSVMEPELRRTLLELVERLRRALLQYHLTGIDGVLEAADFSMGFAIREAASTESTGVRATLGEVARTVVFLWNVVRASLGFVELGLDAGEALQQIAEGSAPRPLQPGHDD